MTASSSELSAAKAAFDRASRWMLDHVGEGGVPDDAEDRNGWSRLGWALVIAGKPDVAAAVVSWAAVNRIGEDGGYLAGRLDGQAYIASYPHYWLGSYVISAWLAGRTDLAMRSMAYLRSQQDKATGGIPMKREADGHADPVCDILSTAQAGLSALVTGDHETAEGCARWVRRVAEQQSADASLIFHSACRGRELWSDPDPAFAWAAIADFEQPRQAYYTPGMGAVFLARYAGRYGCVASRDAARRLVAFNLSGTAAQFEDLESVQACKFGWAVAELSLVDANEDWTPWVKRMVGWFVDRQHPEGWWGPSKFVDPNPTVADRLVKTSEHLMELSVCMAALGSEIADAANQPLQAT